MQTPDSKSRRRERGGVLVEFSVAVMALWLIVAATLDFGRAFAASHVLQSAARTATRALALQEVAWNADFKTALGSVYDERYLVQDADCLENVARGNNRSLAEELDAQLQEQGLILNRMLQPLMIFEVVSVDGPAQRLIRYPGALLRNGLPQRNENRPCSTRFTVGVPVVDDTLREVRFHAVVEELDPGAFGLSEEDPPEDNRVLPGTVTMRLHYPFQAVGLSAWRIIGGTNRPVELGETDGYAIEDLDKVGASMIDALDDVDADGSSRAYAVNEAGATIPVYAGRMGLGVQGLLNKQVRPFRRVITAQAIMPREVVSTPIPEASSGGQESSP